MDSVGVVDMYKQTFRNYLYLNNKAFMRYYDEVNQYVGHILLVRAWKEEYPEDYKLYERQVQRRMGQ